MKSEYSKICSDHTKTHDMTHIWCQLPNTREKKTLCRVMLLPKVSQDQDSISQIGLGGCNSIIQSLIHFALSLEVDWVNRWQVERYDVMGDLYQQLNFHRKASFFKRVAAMHCVNPMLPSPAWSECYHLILQAFPGFRMSFDPQHYQTPGLCLLFQLKT